MTTLHDFTLPAIDGQDRSLEDLEGQVALVVNVASRCGLTPQYEGLSASTKYGGASGLGFPCNQFRARSLAPGGQTFCSSRTGSRSLREGRMAGADTLFAWLTSQPTERGRDVQWNGKFLVGKDGAVRAG